MEDELSVGNMAILEYKYLKQEQLARIGTRDNLIYVTLASLAAVAAATLQVDKPSLLLLLPPACLVLGWTYLANDQKVSAIGQHIREELIPRIRAELGTEVALFTWEFRHRSDARRRVRKRTQLAIDLMTFCLPTFVSVIVFLMTAPPPWLVVLAVVEIVGGVLLAWAIVDNADLTKEQVVDE